MKKLSLLLALILAFTFCVQAQNNETKSSKEEKSNNKEERRSDGKDFFIGAGIRGNVFINDDATHYSNVWTQPSLGGEVYFGKWFNTKMGARVLVEGGSLHPFFQKLTVMEHEKFLAGRVDFLLDLTNCIRQDTSDQFYSLVPYVGIGFGYSFNRVYQANKTKSSGSFLFGGGLLNTFRLSDVISAYLNLGIDFVNANFDGWKDPKGKPLNGIFSPSIGVVYSF